MTRRKKFFSLYEEKKKFFFRPLARLRLTERRRPFIIFIALAHPLEWLRNGGQFSTQSLPTTTTHTLKRLSLNPIVRACLNLSRLAYKLCGARTLKTCACAGERARAHKARRIYCKSIIFFSSSFLSSSSSSFFCRMNSSFDQISNVCGQTGSGRLGIRTHARVCVIFK